MPVGCYTYLGVASGFTISENFEGCSLDSERRFRMICMEKEQNHYCQPLIPEITSQCHCASELSVCYPTFEIGIPNLKQITHLHLVDVHLNFFFPAVALTMLSSMKPMLG